MDVSDFDSVTSLSKYLTCTICLDVYDQPVTLNECQHTFCLKCFKQLFLCFPNLKVIKCPNCKQECNRRAYFKNEQLEVLANYVKSWTAEEKEATRTVEIREKVEEWLNKCVQIKFEDMDYMDVVFSDNCNDEKNKKVNRKVEKIKKSSSKKRNGKKKPLNRTVSKSKDRPRKQKIQGEVIVIDDYDSPDLCQMVTETKILSLIEDDCIRNIENELNNANFQTSNTEKDASASKTDWSRMKQIKQRITRKAKKYKQLDISMECRANKSRNETKDESVSKFDVSDEDRLDNEANITTKIQNEMQELSHEEHINSKKVQEEDIVSIAKDSKDRISNNNEMCMNGAVTRNTKVNNSLLNSEKQNNDDLIEVDVFSIPTQKLNQNYECDNELKFKNSEPDTSTSKTSNEELIYLKSNPTNKNALIKPVGNKKPKKRSIPVKPVKKSLRANKTKEKQLKKTCKTTKLMKNLPIKNSKITKTESPNLSGKSFVNKEPNEIFNLNQEIVTSVLNNNEISSEKETNKCNNDESKTLTNEYNKLEVLNISDKNVSDTDSLEFELKSFGKNNSPATHISQVNFCKFKSNNAEGSQPLDSQFLGRELSSPSDQTYVMPKLIIKNSLELDIINSTEDLSRIFSEIHNEANLNPSCYLQKKNVTTGKESEPNNITINKKISNTSFPTNKDLNEIKLYSEESVQDLENNVIVADVIVHQTLEERVLKDLSTVGNVEKSTNLVLENKQLENDLIPIANIESTAILLLQKCVKDSQEIMSHFGIDPINSDPLLSESLENGFQPLSKQNSLSVLSHTKNNAEQTSKNFETIKANFENIGLLSKTLSSNLMDIQKYINKNKQEKSHKESQTEIHNLDVVIHPKELSCQKLDKEVEANASSPLKPLKQIKLVENEHFDLADDIQILSDSDTEHDQLTIAGSQLYSKSNVNYNKKVNRQLMFNKDGSQIKNHRFKRIRTPSPDGFSSESVKKIKEANRSKLLYRNDLNIIFDSESSSILSGVENFTKSPQKMTDSEILEQEYKRVKLTNLSKHNEINKNDLQNDGNNCTMSTIEDNMLANVLLTFENKEHTEQNSSKTHTQASMFTNTEATNSCFLQYDNVSKINELENHTDIQNSDQIADEALDKEVEILTSFIVEDSIGSDNDLFEDDVVDVTPSKDLGTVRNASNNIPETSQVPNTEDKVIETTANGETPSDIKMNLNPIVLAQADRFCPLQFTNLNQTKPISQGTPKQKSILNYITATPQKLSKSDEATSSLQSVQLTPKASSSNQPKFSACITCSRLEMKELKQLLLMTTKLRIKYTKEFSECVTHLVVAVDENNQVMDHTMKYVLAVAHGIWIMPFAWVRESFASGGLLPEEPFEVLDLSGLPGPQQSRLTRKTHPLFKNFVLCCADPFTNVTRKDLEDIFVTLGGEITHTPNDLLQNRNGKNCLIITEDKDSAHLNQCQMWRDTLNVLVVEVEWLSRCVGQYKIISAKPFLLCAEGQIENLGYSVELIEDVHNQTHC